MSGLDANLAALFTENCQWQARSGVDVHGQDTWAAAVTLKCYPAFGQLQIQRKDGTVYSSDMALYFDATDTHVQSFQLGDRFSAPGIAGGQAMEAVAIEPSYSPGPSLGAAMSAWIVEVRL